MQVLLNLKGLKTKIYSGGGSVVQCWVSAPPDSLVRRELARALAFEEENAFTEGVVVVMATTRALPEMSYDEEKEEDGGSGKCREVSGNSRHF